MKTQPEPAVVGIFRYQDQLARAVERLRQERCRFTAFSPTRGEWLQRLIPRAESPIRAVTLFGGIAGIVSGLGLAVYTFLSFRLLMSGKPVVPFVPLVIIAFEFMVLVGVLATLAGLLILAGMPRRRLPEGYDPRFSDDRFGLVVPTTGDSEDVKRLLREAGAEEVRDVPA